MAKVPSNIMALISPPEEHLHSFSQPSSPAAITPAVKEGKTVLNASQLPLSPQSPAVTTFDLANKFRNWPAEFPNGRPVMTNPDPILYPERRQSSEYNPLFEDESYPAGRLQSPPAFLKRPEYTSAVPPNTPSVASSSTSIPISSILDDESKDALIDDHYKTRVLPQYVQSKSKVTKWSKPRRHLLPSRDQYKLVLDIAWQSTVLRDYNSNPQAYYKRQMLENEENWRLNQDSKRKRSGNGHSTVLQARDDRDKTIVLQQQQIHRVRKPAKKQVDRSGTPEVKHRRTPVKKTKALFHFNDIPDYAPSADTIPGDKNFRVTWNGQPLDLSSDPERHLLHPAEIQLASKLRFPCDQYLKTKRRVFVGRVNNLIKHPNKQFCKTDAQQVGGVDVNKLSQLWEAYNSIGWFHASHFKEHVAKVRDATLAYDPKNTKWVEHKELFGF